MINKTSGVVFFFRKPRRGAYSIENLFSNIQQGFGSRITYTNQFLSFDSRGILNRLLLILEAYSKRGEINHITGDVNFISLLLPKSNSILTIHDVESLERGNSISNSLLKLFWLKWPVDGVKYVTVVSETTKKRLLNILPVKADKIVVIPNIISDVFQFVPELPSAIKPVILQIGTKYNKNLERTIEAIAGINCKFVVVGPLSEGQQNLLKHHQIDYQNYVGISEDELKMLYINSSIVTFVSLFEGFGMPILEAQATGRPVITSNCSAMPEVAGEGGALFVDPFNVNEIHEAVCILLRDYELRKKIVLVGLQNCKRYNKEVIAQKYIDLYQRLV